MSDESCWLLYFLWSIYINMMWRLFQKLPNWPKGSDQRKTAKLVQIVLVRKCPETFKKQILLNKISLLPSLEITSYNPLEFNGIYNCFASNDVREGSKGLFTYVFRRNFYPVRKCPIKRAHFNHCTGCLMCNINLHRAILETCDL